MKSIFNKIKKFKIIFAIFIVIITIQSCSPYRDFFYNQFVTLFRPIDKVNKLKNPIVKDAKLSVVMIGHATVLIQLYDKIILTDPLLTEKIAMIQKRFVEPGVEIDDIPKVDATLISHNHMDHLSLPTLGMLENKITRMFVPEEGLTYIPNFDFPTYEIKAWQTWNRDGLKITAIPVQHRGGRYGLDENWMKVSCTGYMIQYKDVTVFFGGDTGYNDTLFKNVNKHFPKIDLALLPIAPISPREFMKRAHIDPIEGVMAFEDLKADRMMPIHFDTFPNSTNDSITEAPNKLSAITKQKYSEDKLRIIKPGERWVIK